MKPEELMGQVVTVTRIVECIREGLFKKFQEDSVEPRAGWITGHRTIYEGRTIPGGAYDDEYEPSYFMMTGSIHVWLVCFWPTMKPVMVPDGGYDPGGKPVSPQELSMVQFREQHPEQYKDYCQFMRRDTKNAPRDSKGRFIKTGGTPLCKS